jgi:transposase, IS30 family
MRYTHLTPLERTELYRMRVLDKNSIPNIAKEMNRSASTISRELKRNLSEEQFYLPDTAQKQAEDRRYQSKEKFGSINESTIEEIKQHLEKCHSPEQLSGRMKLEGKKSVSYETIYQMIYTDHQGLGICKKYLRQKQKRRRRKGSKQKRCIIPGRVGIENRPAIADKKSEIGHWESDTVIGSNHDGVVVTHVDKASKYLMAGLARNKTMEQINQVTIGLFKNIKQEHRITMTFDNGREFCGHQKIGEKLELDTFFARPYHSWERGLNEHTNGLIRQFFPKDMNFKTVKPERLQKVVDLINNRPRKSLDYRTPHEVFYSVSVDDVALQI